MTDKLIPAQIHPLSFTCFSLSGSQESLVSMVRSLCEGWDKAQNWLLGGTEGNLLLIVKSTTHTVLFLVKIEYVLITYFAKQSIFMLSIWCTNCFGWVMSWSPQTEYSFNMLKLIHTWSIYSTSFFSLIRAQDCCLRVSGHMGERTLNRWDSLLLGSGQNWKKVYTV